MTKPVEVYFDLCCPYCYLAHGYLAEMRKEFSLPVKWVPWEIHPEYPPEGIHMPWRGLDKLRAMGEPVGLSFTDLDFSPNTRLALQVVEYAQARGAADDVVHRLFMAYFAQGKDLSKKSVLLETAQEAGLAVDEVASVLDRNAFLEALQEHDRTAEEELHLEVVPSFVRDGKVLLKGSTTMTFQEFRSLFPKLLPQG